MLSLVSNQRYECKEIEYNAICQLVQSYDLSSNDKANTTTRHHEDIPSAQKSFLKDVSQMTETIEDLGNPFLEESEKLVSLDLNVSTDSKDFYTNLRQTGTTNLKLLEHK